MGKKKACPRLTVEVVGRDPYLEFTAKTPAGLAVGSVDIDGYGSRALMITNIYVKSDFQRCGVGTKLYEAAAKYACESGATLRSDTRRTKCSDQFWQKQLKKGRATAAGGGPAKTHATDDVDCGHAILDRSGVAYYTLKRCPTSLAGQRGKK